MGILLFSLYTLAYSNECIDASELDFTFYCSSSEDDLVSSSYNPNGILAKVISKYSFWASIPESIYIWEPSNCGVCNVTTTKHFFLIAQATKVNLYLFGDDYATATINNLNSCNGIYTVITPCDMTTATKPGLNELKIEVKNTGGPGGLAYKLEIKLPL